MLEDQTDEMKNEQKAKIDQPPDKASVSIQSPLESH